MCKTCVPGASRGQKRVSDPVELELQMLVNYHVGSGKQNFDPLYKQQAFDQGLFLQPLHSFIFSTEVPSSRMILAVSG